MSDHDDQIRKNDEIHDAASEGAQPIHQPAEDGNDGLYTDGDEILILDADLDSMLEIVDATVEVTESDPSQPGSSQLGGDANYVPPLDPATEYDAEVTEGEAQPMVVRTAEGARRNRFLGIGGIAAAVLIGAGYFMFLGNRAETPQPTPTKVMKAPTTPDPVPPTDTIGATDPEPASPGTASPGTTGNPTDTTDDPTPKPVSSDPEPATAPEPVPTPPAPEPVAKPKPVVAKSDDAVLRELVQIALVEGFATIGQINGERRSGIRVRLRGGKEVILAHGESLVELKNGHHFKGVIVHVSETSITMRFPYGKMRILKRDLNHVVPTTQADIQPLDAYRTAIVHLGNGNHLRGKVVKVTEDRVVLGFPSAQIVVPRAAMATREDAIEYIEAENRRQLFGAGRGQAASATGSKRSTGEQGAAYYDFANGFVIIPPRSWVKFNKDAIIGFKAAPEAKLQGALSLGGLYVRSSALPTVLGVLESTLPNDVPNVQIVDAIRRTDEDETPWDYQFDCRQQVAEVDDPFAPAKSEKVPALLCRVYIFNRFGKVFVLAMFASEPDFKRMAPQFDECARTFEYRS